MRKAAAAAAFACAAFTAAQAAWYWPFGGGGENKQPRISELVEEASVLMDAAADLAAEGEYEEAVGKYREAHAELERVEYENPARAATAEFATVRNKKAYIEAAVDSLLLKQAEANANAVAVTDTTALERRYKTAKALEKNPDDRKLILQAAAGDLSDKHYSAAKAKAAMLLARNARDVAALNIYAAAEAASGRPGEAERRLRAAIMADEQNASQDATGKYARSHHAYYNLARLLIEYPRLCAKGSEPRAEARRLYETGRKECAGPVDEALEKATAPGKAAAPGK